MTLWTDLLALAAYLCAITLVHRAGHGDAGLRRALLVAAAAMLLHATGLGLTGRGEFSLSLGGALSLFLWQCALVHALIVPRYPLWHLAGTVWALAAAGLVLARILPPGTTAPSTLDLALRTHVLLSLTAYAVLTLAALQLAAYALMDRRLRQHARRPTQPELPLLTMERLAFGLITAGFALLCLAVASGFLFVDDFFAQHLVHKTVLSLIACLVFAALLLGRNLRGWRGTTAIRWAMAGYASLLLAYFGSKLVLEQLLGRSWS